MDDLAQGVRQRPEAWHREDLAIRTVTASLRSALREICADRAERGEQRARVAGVLGWAYAALRAHEQAVARLQTDAPGEALGEQALGVLRADLDDARNTVAQLERSLDERPAAAGAF